MKATSARLNPFTLAAIIVVQSFMIPLLGSWGFAGCLLFSVALLLWQAPTRGPRLLAVVGLCALLFGVLMGLSRISMMFHSITGMLVILFRMLPMLVLAQILTTYSASELLSACRGVRLPQWLCVGLTVFWCYLSQMHARVAALRMALKIRGLARLFAHPLRYFEHHMVPLLFQSIDVSNTMTCSIITKGIEYPCTKTNYRNVRFRMRDFACVTLACTSMGVLLWLGY
ncbi:MAG: energy-coupling factor transporter transmembrane component T [Atopobium sp.]|uniref:energy-coupling factor transporter transmembrane component T family protein n=1 Tax=Atopobium sp. TaxID=1872650 RepID=UPI002A7EAF20|nr:energy-coupling factor transporter transmembrane component T [Atopobium sp.]MDY4523061.1 energy-coupling factor transporter transmembrane component T [Atopobium sp.]